MICPGRLPWETEKADKGDPRSLSLVTQQDGAAHASIGMELLRSRNQMAHGMFPIGEIDGSLVARGILSERDFFAHAVREGQREGRLLMDRRRDGSDVRIVAEDAQQGRLAIYSNVAIHPDPDAGRNLRRGALVFKQPEPQMCVLHRPLLPASPASRSASGFSHRHRPVSVHWSTAPGGERSVYHRPLRRRSLRV